jgi:tetratricopeptide (TPR) repeat protein
MLGRVLAARGRLDEAEATFREVLAANPSAPASYRELALVLLGRRDAEGALAVLERGLEATDGSLLMTVDLSALLVSLGQIDRGIDLYERYLAADPDSEPAANNLAMLLATHRTDPASLERAAALAERLRDSDVPGYLDTLGWVHHRRGESTAAISVLREVVEREPDVPTFRYHLGAALAGSGEREEALGHLERALALAGRFPERGAAAALLEELRGS